MNEPPSEPADSRASAATPPLLPPENHQTSPVGRTDEIAPSRDEDRGRVFPCPSCGADLVFHIGQQRMKCPYCGHEEAIALPEGAEVRERDFEAMVSQLAKLHDKDRNGYAGMQEIRCRSCAGTVLFQGALTSTRCPYCASPIQIDRAEQAKNRIEIDGVLPFKIGHDVAAKNMATWVKSRWFAPNDFLSQGVEGDFNGVYLPFWTFDAMTFTRYIGQRGDNYTVTVGTGKNRRTETRTRWSSASGSFQRFFDDVLVDATTGLNRDLIHELEPWPLAESAAYNQEMLAGFLARTYEVELKAGFEQARDRIRSALESDVRRRIGGDQQRISKMDVNHSAVTFKHLLLPVWMMAYRYHGHPFQVLVNATTGEVQGERPYSWIKITIAVILGAIAALLLYFAVAASRG